MRYCGREFLDVELAEIRRTIAEDPNRTRWAISQRVCETLGWRTPDGGLQEMIWVFPLTPRFRRLLTE